MFESAQEAHNYKTWKKPTIFCPLIPNESLTHPTGGFWSIFFLQNFQEIIFTSSRVD